MCEERVRAYPLNGEKGELLKFKGNLEEGDKVSIKKHPALSFVGKEEQENGIRGVVVKETDWIYVVEIRKSRDLYGEERCYNITLNKANLFITEEKYISEVVFKVSKK